MPCYWSETEGDDMEKRKGASLKPSQAEGNKSLNLSMECEVIRRAKILAIQRDSTLSKVVEDLLVKWINHD